MNLMRSISSPTPKSSHRASATLLLMSSVAVLFGACASMPPPTEKVNANPDPQRMAGTEMARRQLAQSELSNTQKSIDLAAANAATAPGQASLNSRDAQLNELELELKALNAKNFAGAILGGDLLSPLVAAEANEANFVCVPALVMAALGALSQLNYVKRVTER